MATVMQTSTLRTEEAMACLQQSVRCTPRPKILCDIFSVFGGIVTIRC